MMDIFSMLMMLFIGIFGGFISGLVGIGGAIIIYPAILVLPILFGFPGYTPYVASGLTSVQVFFSTLSGTLRVWKKPAFSPKLIIYMGGGMFVGSSLGALIANVIDERMINIVYVVIAILALLLMFVKVNVQSKATEFKVISIVSIGLGIGIVSGIVGAGGSFIVIPVLLGVFNLPMNTVVANSIAIAFVSSIGSFAIKLLQGYVPLTEALFLIIGSVIFAPIGLRVGQGMSSHVQKSIVSILIMIAIVQIIF